MSPGGLLSTGTGATVPAADWDDGLAGEDAVVRDDGAVDAPLGLGVEDPPQAVESVQSASAPTARARRAGLGSIEKVMVEAWGTDHETTMRAWIARQRPWSSDNRATSSSPR